MPRQAAVHEITHRQRARDPALHAARPGKQTLNDPVPHAPAPTPPGVAATTATRPAAAHDTALSAGPRPSIQALFGRPAAPRDGATGGDEVHVVAARGLESGGAALPHLDKIQASFGPQHDVSRVQAHVGGPAAAAATAIGAQAYASNEHIAFASPPDLHTTAHEAAHVIQQRAGVSLAGGVGQCGDGYERAADAVADAVVRGEPTHDLLGPATASGGGRPAVQRKVPEHEQPAVTDHHRHLQLRYPQATIPKHDVLADVIASHDTATAAIAALDELMSPTGELKTLVRQHKFQEALTKIRATYHPAAAQQFDLAPTDDYAKVIPSGTPIPSGIPFGTVANGQATNGKLAVVYIHQHWIERWVLEDQIGSLLNTIEHEATHAGQKNSATTPFSKDNDVMELEAYSHEILTVADKHARGDEDLPTQAQLTKGYEAGQQHFKTILASRSETAVNPSDAGLATHMLRWAEIESLYPALSSALEERDAKLDSSHFEEKRFATALAEYEAMSEELSKLEAQECSKFSNEFIQLSPAAGNVYRRLLGSHQELHGRAQLRLAPQMKRVYEIYNEFSRYHMYGPRRTKQPTTRSASRISLPDLPEHQTTSLSLPPPPPAIPVPSAAPKATTTDDVWGDWTGFSNTPSNLAPEADGDEWQEFDAAPAQPHVPSQDDERWDPFGTDQGK